MLGWLLTGGIALLFGAGGFFALSLFLAVYFPRLTQILFVVMVLPVWTAWFSIWGLIIGWTFSWCDFSWASYKHIFFLFLIPLGVINVFLMRGVREIGIDRGGLR